MSHPKNNKPINIKSQLNNRREDVFTTKSSKSGLAGFFETFLRKFRVGAFITALIPVYMLGITAMGLAAAPGVWLFETVLDLSINFGAVFRYPLIGITLITAYMLYGFSLIFIIPFWREQ